MQIQSLLQDRPASQYKVRDAIVTTEQACSQRLASNDIGVKRILKKGAKHQRRQDSGNQMLAGQCGKNHGDKDGITTMVKQASPATLKLQAARQKAIEQIG